MSIYGYYRGIHGHVWVYTVYYRGIDGYVMGIHRPIWAYRGYRGLHEYLFKYCTKNIIPYIKGYMKYLRGFKMAANS